MKNIYHDARIVIAWLGSAPDADECLTLFNGCAVLNSSGTEKDEYMGVGLNKTVRAAFFNFMSHPYWQRAWIIQEIVVASRITIAYGHNYIGWDMLEGASRIMLQGAAKMTGDFAVEPDVSVMYGLRQASTICQMRIKYQAQTLSMSLNEVLTLSDSCKATDPRDKVYAMLGLSTSTGVQPIKPDYGKTESQLCIDVASYLSEHHLQSVLSRAGIGYRRSNLSLPSWVPDYTVKAPTTPLFSDPATSPEQICFPTSITEIDVTINPYHPILTTRCLIFDSIHHLGPIYPSVEHSSGKIEYHRPEDGDILFEIDAWIRSNTKFIHYDNSDESFDEILWRTLVSNAYGRGQPRTRPAPAEFGASYKNLLLQRKRMLSDDIEEKDMESTSNSVWDSYAKLADSTTSTAHGRRIAIMHYKGSTCMGPTRVTARGLGRCNSRRTVMYGHA